MVEYVVAATSRGSSLALERDRLHRAVFGTDGDLSDLATDDKSSVLNALNEVEAEATGETATFTRGGILAVTVGKHRYPIPTVGLWVIESVVATVGVAPAGSAVIVDVNKNGSTVFENQADRPTIEAATMYAVGGTPTIATAVPGDSLTVDVDQVGSDFPGENLTVTIRLRRTD